MRMVIQITASAPDHTVTWMVERSADLTCWYAEQMIYYRPTRKSHRNGIERVEKGIEFANERLVELADDGYKVQKSMTVI